MGEHFSNITVVTGAGVSASAGIPTYRDGGSEWTDPEFEKRSHASQYGNHLDYLHPKWLNMYRNMSKAEPTPFHQYVAEKGWNVITQNIDGLHKRAGTDEARLIELHGSLMRWRGLKDKNFFHPDEIVVNNDGKLVNADGKNRIRPDVVLFGERVNRAYDAESLIVQSDVVIYAGTSGFVSPVCDWHMSAKHSVLVNLQRWGKFHEFFQMKADDWVILDRLSFRR